jgi:hypothetical protein
MNLRALTVKYMGWCPGAKSAARFVPDRDIPPTRMAVFIILFGSVAAASYVMIYRSLVCYGMPSPTVDNEKPRLIAVDDSIYLAALVDIGDGFEMFSNRYVCLTKMTAEGQLLEASTILDLRRAFLASMDIMVSTDGKWHMVYQKYRTGGFYYLDNDLIYIYSDDGENWEKPVAVSKGGLHSSHSIDISLTEVGNGEIILCYREYNERTFATAYYSTYRPKEGWETPIETSWSWYGVSSFLDKDGVVAIVGVPYPEESLISIDGGAYLSGEWSKTYVTRMNEEGGWVEPRDVNYGGGIRAQIMYSQVRDGYYILINGDWGEAYVQLAFSDDLENWSNPINFGNAYNPTLAELKNGTLLLVFERHDEPLSGRTPTFGGISHELFLTTSREGSIWSTPRRLETIVDEGGLRSTISDRRSMFSILSSILASVLVVLLIYRRPCLKPSPAWAGGMMC